MKLAYVAATAAVALLTVLGRFFQADTGAAFLLYTAAVTFAAWYGGRGPGVAAAIAAAVAGDYWVVGRGAWAFSSDALAIITVFIALSAGIILLTEQLRRTRGKLDTLQQVTENELAYLDLQPMLEELLNRVTEVLNAEVAAVLLREDAVLVPVASRGLAAESAVAATPVGKGFAGRIAEQKEVSILNDVSADLVASGELRDSGVCAVIGAPMIVAGEARGVVVVGSKQPRAFVREEGQLLQLVANRVALAVERARAFQREREARRQAEAASEAKDRLLATVSHELRTPLTVITGWLWTLRQNAPGQREQAIEGIDRHAQTLARLIDDLLDVARAMTGKLQLTVGPVQVSDVLKKASDVMLTAMEAKGLKFSMTADAELPTIAGDADRLQQVFWNLLSNAVKFTPSGGRVRAHVSRSGVNVVVTVIDSGSGMAQEFLPHVFERFRQEDDSTTRQHGGLGLGLSIAKNIVELHGGTVEAASEGEGRGSVFTVVLPVPAIETRTSALADSAPALLDGVRILFVDDQADARHAVGRVLEQFGAKVTTAATVGEAFALLRASRPDVLLADIALPDEDGFALINRLRSDDAGRAIPAAALTAFGKEHRDRILQAGYGMYIPKPIAPPDLAELLRQLTAGSPMH